MANVIQDGKSNFGRFILSYATTTFAAILTICLFLGQASAAVNVLTNPGFESGTTGWSGLGCSFTTTTAVYRSGSRSGYATGRNATWNGIQQSLMGKMEVGKTYNVSGWMMLENAPSGSDQIKVTIKKTDSSGTNYTPVNQSTGYNGQWVQLFGQYTLTVSGTLMALDIYFELPAVDVNYYLDDVNVAETGDWKQEANARIEQIRKRDAQITVVNSQGQPISDINVQIDQVKHRFAFGSCINGRVLSDANYAQFFNDHFEWAVMENESKWYSNEYTQGNVTYATADGIYDWCSVRGITMRGHCIYWEVEQNVQDWIKNLSYAPLPATSALRTAVENRMNSAVNHFKGKFVHWDVDNEMLHGSFYKDRLGDSIHTWMFQAAHEIDPNCKLFVNDYSVVSGNETETYKTQIQNLLDDGAPVQGIGAQCHMGGSSIDTFTVYSRLDSLAQLGLPIWCTEYDFAAADVNVRAEGLERFYRTAFSHPAVEGILMWGFWQNSHWRADSYIVNADWSLNQAGIRFESLLNEWTTQDTNTTDSSGNVNFRGFHGTYEVTLTISGSSPEVRTIELEPGETPAEFTLTLNTPGDCDEVQFLGFRLNSDINGDCFVDYEDLDIIASHWLLSGCGGIENCYGADFEPDNNVDFADFGTFGLQWTQCNDPLDPSCTTNWNGPGN
jgi:GH35 family endo-1,4-beta-xylanase